MIAARPEFPNHIRDLPPELGRVAVFIVAMGAAEGTRKASEKTVASCEGDLCAIRKDNSLAGGAR